MDRTSPRVLSWRLLLIAAVLVVLPGRTEPGTKTDSVIVSVPYDSVTVQFSQGTYVTEAGKEAVITVTISGNPAADVQVKYATSDGDNPGEAGYYTPASGTLTFSNGGAASQTFAVKTHLGKIKKSANVDLALTIASGPAILGSPPTAVLTIIEPKVAEFHVQLTNAGKFIVPGSKRNAAQFTWNPALVKPKLATLNVYNNKGDLVREVEEKDPSFGTKTFAEILWNGQTPIFQPLPEGKYKLEVVVKHDGKDVKSKEKFAKVEEWKLDIDIPDTPQPNSFATGPIAKSISTFTLEVKVGFQGEKGDENVTFGDIKLQKDNITCSVPLEYKFYTTPTSPYDIRYKVDMQQIKPPFAPPPPATEYIMDGARNRWDMDPTQDGRQTKGVWLFGVNAVTKEGKLGPELRDFQEKYSN